MATASKIAGWGVTAALVCLPGFCFAQQQVNTDGRLLDHNLQVGSNGINPATPVPNSAINNQIPNRPTSDDMLRFEAVSLPSGVVAVNPKTPGYALPQVSFYTTAASTVPGQAQSGGTSVLILQPFSGTYHSAQIFSGAIAQQIQRSGPGFATDSIGIVTQPNGQLVQINASSLTGVQAVAAGTIPGSPAALQAIKAVDQSSGYSSPTPGPEVTSNGATGPGQTPVYSPTVDNRIASPSTALGMQLYQQSLVSSLPLSQEVTSDQIPIEQIRSQMLSPLAGYKSDAGQDPYMDLLARLKQNKGAAPAHPATVPKSRTAIVPSPSPLELEKARLAAIAAHRAAQGLPPLEQAKPASPESPEAAKARKEKEQKVNRPMAELLSQLKDQGAPLKSLSGTRLDRATEFMRQGESELATGRYLAAEEKYRLALGEEPGRPLAVVGLIHAQLGAGMIRSAAYNLRSLFEDHPELIATRYEARLMPAAPRLQWVRRQLEEMLRTTNREDPALMLAYLGYQLGSTELVKYGLDYAEARQPEDPLVPLLRRLWLPDADTASPNGTAK